MEGGGGGGQNRARGSHLTATNMLSTFSGYNQRFGGGGGGDVVVCFRLIQPAGWVLSVCFRLIQPAEGGRGGGVLLSAFGRFNQRGGGGGGVLAAAFS